MNCADLEILLCDYLDGTLPEARRREVEEHLLSCAACTETVRDVRGALAFMEKAADVEPPPELLTRIINEVPALAGTVHRKSWYRRILGGRLEPLLQPRYVMGMAMTVLSFSMMARIAHIDVRQLSPADLNPVKIWMSADDHVHRTWDRAVKYYDNLRVVIEIQSRLRDWSDQDQSSAPQKANDKQKGAPAKSNSTGRIEKK